MEIEYIKNKDINRIEYDKTLKRSFNANTFAYSWYLDLVCDDWDLLVQGDYETVSPLPLKKKLGVLRYDNPKGLRYWVFFQTNTSRPKKYPIFSGQSPTKTCTSP